ncbi:hypothetical protein BC940DRAFT_12886 [Gongronella butleri]|nr:hypothetical protein BC940DRAFT_12886 [Gongronella butleri]
MLIFSTFFIIPSNCSMTNNGQERPTEVRPNRKRARPETASTSTPIANKVRDLDEKVRTMANRLGSIDRAINNSALTVHRVGQAVTDGLAELKTSLAVESARINDLADQFKKLVNGELNDEVERTEKRNIAMIEIARAIKNAMSIYKVSWDGSKLFSAKVNQDLARNLHQLVQKENVASGAAMWSDVLIKQLLKRRHREERSKWSKLNALKNNNAEELARVASAEATTRVKKRRDVSHLSIF